MYASGIDAYRKTEILTDDPGKIVIMCYEAAISNLRLVKEYYAQKAYEEKGKKLQKALEIIHSLREALDFEKGGEVAINLDSLYDYMTRRLVQGDIRKDISAFDEVIGMLSELLSAWKDIFYDQLKKTGDDIPARPADKRNAMGILKEVRV